MAENEDLKNTQDEESQEEVAGSEDTVSAAPETGTPAESQEEDMFGEDPFNDDQDQSEEEEDIADEKEESEVASFDQDLDDWAITKGHEKPETDRERKILQTLRDNDRQFHADRAAKKAAKELEDAVKEKAVDKEEDEDADPVDRKITALEEANREERTKRLQTEFYTDRKISEATGKIMADILREKVDKASADKKLQVLDYWKDPAQLEDLLEAAQARELLTTDKTAIEDKAATKERERIAKQQKSVGVKRNAKETVQQKVKSHLDELWDN